MDSAEKNSLKSKLWELALARKLVTVPGVGEFTVQELTGTDRERFEGEMVNRRRMAEDKGEPLDLRDTKAMLIQMSVIDPATGKVLFAPNDVKQLGLVPSKTLEVLFDACQDISGLGQEAVKQAVGN